MHARRDAMPAGSGATSGFQDRFRRLLGKAASKAFRAYGFAECLSEAWTAAGVEVEAGERATVLAAWGTGAARGPSSPPRFSMRVGESGFAIQGACNTHSIVAPRAGSLEVAIDPPAGRQDPPFAMEGPWPMPAPAIIVAIVWRESALRGLRYVANAGDVDGLVRNEIGRLCNPAGFRAARSRPGRD